MHPCFPVLVVLKGNPSEQREKVRAMKSERKLKTEVLGRGVKQERWKWNNVQEGGRRHNSSLPTWMDANEGMFSKTKGYHKTEKGRKRYTTGLRKEGVEENDHECIGRMEKNRMIEG